MATYPVTGAVIGTVVGGPVGMLAGLKVGAVVAIGCGIVGYTVGKVTKKYHGNRCADTMTVLSKTDETTPTVDKKDI